jgi:hypothetical protein
LHLRGLLDDAMESLNWEVEDGKASKKPEKFNDPSEGIDKEREIL